MQVHADPGHCVPFSRRVTPLRPRPIATRRAGPAPRGGVWQRWRLLYDDILRHVRACDRLGVVLTVEQLAEELDEALGLVERRLDELSGLRVLYVHADRRIELESSDDRLCG